MTRVQLMSTHTDKTRTTPHWGHGPSGFPFRGRAWEPYTSETEYEVDALAPKTEEGRGDRRNVRGELHTSDEPRDSE